MTDRAIVTCVTRDYLAYARALMHRVERHEPDVDRFVVVVDRLPDDRETRVAGATVIHGDELGIDAWARYSFQYTPFELSCAIKPHAVDHLLHRRGYRAVVYLDGDMGLYGPLTPVWQALRTDAIVLTPHLVHPLPDDGRQPHASSFCLCGTFNAGLFAVRACDHGRDFVRWWTSMVRKDCIVDLAGGMFVDQRWLCLAPGLFDGVKVLRHCGINAGHWTLSHARCEHRSTAGASTTDITLDGDPLVLFHFSGMTPQKPDAYLDFQNRVRLDDHPRLAELAEEFRVAVRASGLDECAAWGCRTSTLDDGTPIHPAWREAIRRDEPAFVDVADPFGARATPDLVRRFRRVEWRARRWRSDWRLSRARYRLSRQSGRSAWTGLRDTVHVLRDRFRAA